MENLIDDLQRQLNELKEVRKPHEQTWDEIIESMYPFRWVSWDRRSQRGRRKANNIYNTYPLQMLNIMADGIQGHMVSDSFRWMQSYMSKASNDPQITKWLQDVDDQFYFEFQRSNFYEAINEYIQDAGSIGTAHIYAQDSMDGSKISFRVMNPYDVWISENFDGMVDTHFREFYLTIREIYEKFGVYCPEIEQFVNNKRWEKEIKFIHAVYPRFMNGTAPDERPFASVYIDVDHKKVVRESGYYVNPFATWRWKKVPHEYYGRSPAWEELRSIKTLNEMSKTLLRAAQKHADPPMWVPAEMKNQFDNRAGALNYYQDPQRVPMENVSRSNYPIGEEREQMVMARIREAFKVDFFLMLQQSEREMTATEIIEKQNEKVAILSAVIGRFQTEALNPIVDIVFDISSRAGRMPEVPEKVSALYAGERIDVDYKGPLAQAQKRMKVQGTQAALQVIAPYAQIDPSVMDRINMDVVAKDVVEAYGMRQDAIRSDREVKMIQQQRAQAQAMQAQLQAMESAAKIQKDAGGGMNQQSEAARVMQGR